MRNQNRVVISTGTTEGSYRFVETPEGNIIAETLSSYDSLGNPIWTSANPTRSMIQAVGSRLGWRIDTKARARRARYEEYSRGN